MTADAQITRAAELHQRVEDGVLAAAIAELERAGVPPERVCSALKRAYKRQRRLKR